MAEKRMFAKKITDSDAFLEMPLSSQALYFHLCMHADDDGFVNSPKKITRLVGASEDDLKLLLLKRFVIGFESGVIVIKHWRMHNTLKSDRYKPTDYQEEFSRLAIKDNKAYTDHTPALPPVEPVWNQSGTKVVPQYSIDKIRLDKNRLEEDRVDNNPPIVPPKGDGVAKSPDTAFDMFWSAYPRKVGKADARKAWKKIKGVDLGTVLSAVERLKRSEQWTRENGKYIPHPATWLNRGGWDDEEPEALPTMSKTAQQLNNFYAMADKWAEE